MSNQPSTIATTVQKTNLLLKEIAQKLNWEDRPEQAYSALRITLHILRDRLPLEEAVQLSAQLPTLVRGIYFEGWKPSELPKKMHKQEFIDRFQNESSFAADTETVVNTVLLALSEYVSEGELKDIHSVLPKDIEEMLV